MKPKPNLASINLPAFEIEGHRGCRGLMPENTWPAMQLALDLNVSTLEMDVVITKDKQVLVSHEPWFNADITTKPDGSFIKEDEQLQFNIYQMNYAEVKQYDIGLKPHPRFPKQQKLKAVKPLLSEIIDNVAQYMQTATRPYPFYNIEIKSLPCGDEIFHPQPNEFVALIMAVIKAKALEEQVLLQSFDVRPLQYLHQHYPSIRTALLIEDYDKRSLAEQLHALGYIPNVYSPEFSLVNKALVQQCHQRNMKLIPWTVNERNTIDKLVAMGVDGIITDYPDLFISNS